MTHVISDDCISCGACESECPSQAISQGTSVYEIDPGKCTDCANCVSVCPASAISKKA